MTKEEICDSNKDLLTAVDVSNVLGASPNTIRRQAHDDPDLLGFPVSVRGCMVRIPRIPFIRFMGWGESNV